VLGVSLTNILLIFFTDTAPADNEVEIPDYIRRDFEEYVKEDLPKHRLAVGEVRYENNDNFEENEIISHFPMPGEVKRILPGQDVRIDFVVSKGRDSYVVENLAVLEWRDVKIKIETYGIIVKMEYEPDDTIPSRHIIRTEPGPETVLKSGDTIIIYVSSGQVPNRVLMPDVVGKSRRDAEWELSRAQIVIVSIIPEFSDLYAPGHITEQSIPANRPVLAKSTRVTLRISKGSIPRDPAADPEETEEHEDMLTE
jgi:beta-lactam-binding protein with PASTA domain